MTKHTNYSKRLHFVTLCCFLLPFFQYTGCGKSAEEKAAEEAAREQAIADSIATAEAAEAEAEAEAEQNGVTHHLKYDTLVNSIDTTTVNNVSSIDTAAQNETIIVTDTTTKLKPEKEFKTPSEKIAFKIPLLKPLLVPNTDTYTGLAVLIDSIGYFIFYGVFISVLLLIISLIIKFMEPDAIKTIVLIEIIALLFLYNAAPYTWFFEKLWGFKVCVTSLVVLIIFDLYRSKQHKNNKQEKNLQNFDKN